MSCARLSNSSWDSNVCWSGPNEIRLTLAVSLSFIHLNSLLVILTAWNNQFPVYPYNRVCEFPYI